MAFVQLEENDRYSLSCSGVMKVRSGGQVYVDHAVSKKDFWFLEYRRTGSLKIEHYKTYKIYLTLKFKKWAGLITGITFYCKRQTNFPSRLLGLKDCYDGSHSCLKVSKNEYVKAKMHKRKCWVEYRFSH